MIINNIPLSLYIHIPWCIKKCPYCDFNSHAVKDNIPEDLYIDKLIADLYADLLHVHDRTLHSIFIGGGTPSLFSAFAYEKLLAAIFKLIPNKSDIEITLEANPGTVEQQRFKDYHSVGINRLSIGCQSFNAKHLQTLGRIHDKDHALRAAEAAHNAGFTNFNLDVMFALPNQTITEALDDLDIAISLHPTHVSWYQLTLEPNTLFHKYPPNIPNDEITADMFTEGQALLATENFTQYEVSAYAKDNNYCQHNVNYWRFGDYLGIGAGAHSKLTNVSGFRMVIPAKAGIQKLSLGPRFRGDDLRSDCGLSTKKYTVLRLLKHKHPKAYIESNNFTAESKYVDSSALPFEFMLNALRLQEPIAVELFQQTTGLNFTAIKPVIERAVSKDLMVFDGQTFYPTTLGRRFLNDLVGLFL